MVLLIQNEEIQDNDSLSLLTRILSHPFVQTKAQELQKMKTTVIDYKQYGKNLYVYQRERATMNILGSADATTCIIVILVSKKSGKASCAHLDNAKGQIGGDNCSIEAMVKTFDKDEQSSGLDIFIAGGMLDSDDNSLETSIALVTALQASKTIFHVQQACFYTLNDIKINGIHNPIIRGLAIELQTGKVFPAEWKDKGASNALRQGRFTSIAALEDIYDSEKDCIVIKPFPYKGMKKGDIQILLQLPDEEILHYLSTSPEVEGPDFVKDTRASLRFWLENPSWEKYFQGKSLLFFWDTETSQWKQIAN